MSPDTRIMTSEMDSSPHFIEAATTVQIPGRCVDGRPDQNSRLGPQMLGGSFHPILISAIYNQYDLDAQFVTSQSKKLKASGYGLGAHRGGHKKINDNVSDCGAADRIINIIETATSEDGRREISSRLSEIYETHKSNLNFSRPFKEILESAYVKIANFSTSRVKVRGENIVSAIERQGGIIENVEGDHSERIAFVNLKKNTTLDTKKLNRQNKQGFNLDVWAIVDQASSLGVDPEFTIASSLILYMATEMVLVEQKGKPALQVAIHF